MTVLTAVAALGSLTFALASMLAVASRLLRVDEDPRIDAVEQMLPHTNCGACGYPGCRPFAEALIAGSSQPGQCTVSNDAGRQAIADFIGVAIGSASRRVARLACAGGNNVARSSAHYQGELSCLALAQVAGGGKACAWGCLGLGDCEHSCALGAITMDMHAPRQAPGEKTFDRGNQMYAEGHCLQPGLIGSRPNALRYNKRARTSQR